MHVCMINDIGDQPTNPIFHWLNAIVCKWLKHDTDWSLEEIIRDVSGHFWEEGPETTSVISIFLLRKSILKNFEYHTRHVATISSQATYQYPIYIYIYI